MAATRELLVRIGVDQAQSQRAVTAFRAVSRETDASRASLEAFRRAGAALTGIPQAAQRTADNFRRLKGESDTLQRAVRELRDELTRLDKTEASPRIAGADLTARGTRTDLSRALSGGASLLGGAAAELPQAARGVLQLGTALTSLNPVLAGASVATLALGAAFGELNRRAEEHKQQIETEIETRRRLISMTSEQARADLERIRINLEFNRSVLNEISQELREYQMGTVGPFQILTDVVVGLNPRVVGLLHNAINLRDETDLLQIQYNVMTRVLEENGLAANDAAEAERQLTEERRRAAEELRRQIGSRLDEEVRLYEFARTASAQAVRERIAAMEEEARTIRRFLRDVGPDAALSEGERAAVEDARRNLEKLTNSIIRMRGEILPLVEARERETAAIERQRDAIRAAAQEYADNVERLRDLEAARATVLADRARDDSRTAQIAALERRIAAAKEREAAQEREQRIGDIRRRGAEQIAELEQDFMARRLKDQQEYAREVARAEDDYGRERLRRLQDLNADLLDLAAARDVAGFVRRQRSGLTDLARGDEDFSVRQQRRLEDFRREQAERAAEFQQRRAERQAQLQQELAEQRAANEQRLSESRRLEQELADLRQRFAEEDRRRARWLEDEKFRTEVAALRRRQAEMVPLLQRAFDPALAAIRNLGRTAEAEFSRLIGLFAALRAQTAAVVTPAGAGGGGAVRRYQHGTPWVPQTGWAYLHRGEAVIPAADNRGRRAISLTVNDQRTIHVGDVATRRTVEEALAHDRAEFLAGLQMAVFGSY